MATTYPVRLYTACPTCGREMADGEVALPCPCCGFLVAEECVLATETRAADPHAYDGPSPAEHAWTCCHCRPTACRCAEGIPCRA